VASGVPIAVALLATVVTVALYRKWLHLRRAEFIRTYRWPPGLLDRLEKHRPGLERKDSALVSRGLRQFFIAYLMSGNRYVSMPSQVADDLWHEFILYTREYETFCRRAFGAFLHHTPAVVLLLQVREHRSGQTDAAAAAVRTGRQAESFRRLRLSSAMRRTAEKRQWYRLLRWRFRR
jgi:hypothetical protein